MNRLDPTATDALAQRPVGPVLQFSLLIVPIVMTTFFLLYALTGWVLEGRHHVNWSIEAPLVAIWVGPGIIAYSVLVATLVKLRGGATRHPLMVSSLVHGLLALLLMLGIFVAAAA